MCGEQQHTLTPVGLSDRLRKGDGDEAAGRLFIEWCRSDDAWKRVPVLLYANAVLARTVRMVLGYFAFFSQCFFTFDRYCSIQTCSLVSGLENKKDNVFVTGDTRVAIRFGSFQKM